MRCYYHNRISEWIWVLLWVSHIQVFSNDNRGPATFQAHFNDAHNGAHNKSKRISFEMLESVHFTTFVNELGHNFASKLNWLSFLSTSFVYECYLLHDSYVTSFMDFLTYLLALEPHTQLRSSFGQPFPERFIQKSAHIFDYWFAEGFSTAFLQQSINFSGTGDSGMPW